MRQFPMDIDQVSSFSAQYEGSRDGIYYADGVLHVPEELADAVAAIDTSIAAEPVAPAQPTIAELKAELASLQSKLKALEAAK